MDLTNDTSLAELFRSEVETHLTTLNGGLLALEQDPGRRQDYESLMRAAHSIKGAARIVGRSAAVQIAHEIEDFFVAAREGRVAITPACVDVLLQGIDLLESTTRHSESGPSDDQLENQPVQAFIEALRRATANVPVTHSTDTSVTTRRSVPLMAPAGEVHWKAPMQLNRDWVREHHVKLQQSLREPATSMRIDLSAVQDVDVMGLAMLVQCHQEGQRRQGAAQGTIRVANASPRIRQLAHVMGLDSMLHDPTSGGAR